MKTYQRIYRFWHTIKFLRFEQLYYRLFYRFFRKHVISGLSCDNPVKTNKVSWDSPALYESSWSTDNEINFIGEKANFNELDNWNDENFSKLWLYNLHYFDDLNAKNHEHKVEFHKQLIMRWIDENPTPDGNGWEPYPLSLRIVNWIKWLSRNKIYDDKIVSSLIVQGIALQRQVEYHILGNHLFANGKALFFLGKFFKGKQADSFLRAGSRIINSQLSEQFLDDGAHFELTPMYHSILLVDLIDILNLILLTNSKQDAIFFDCLRMRLAKGLTWLSQMTHPDGEISFFNDCSFGIAPKPSQIFNYAKVVDVSFTAKQECNNITFSESGYSIINNKQYKVIFDHGEIGPAYLPGHGHADALSLEMSVGKSRVFVNSGTSMYGISEERLRQRKTISHNTVVFKAEDSSEVWSGFRVARRAHCTIVESASKNDLFSIKVKHDGYTRFDKKLFHFRQLDCKSESLTIRDELTIPVEAYFNLHLHPEVNVKEHHNNYLVLILLSGDTLTVRSSGEIRLEDSTWHPKFGASIDNTKIIIPLINGVLETEIKLNELLN